MKITDGKTTANIKMHTYNINSGLSPDFSNDFFDAGLLPYDEETNTYTVPDVSYCIDQANNWATENENNLVFIE